MVSGEVIGLAALFVAQGANILKSLSDSRVIKAKLEEINKRLEKQNGRLDNAEKWELEHVEKFHTKK